MAKKFPYHLIKRYRVYTAFELAEVLGCHRQTVLRWIKDEKIPADKSQKPWLMEGQAIKDFLGNRQTEQKCKLSNHHFFCLGCKEPREAAFKSVDYIQQSTSSGRLVALCPCCCATMNKAISRADLEQIRAKYEVTIQQAQPRLVSSTDALSNVHSTQETKTYDKAQ